MAIKLLDMLSSNPRIPSFCKRWNIRELALFGSAARGEERPDSDVDILASFDPAAEWDLLDILHAQDELCEILGRPVDLVEREALETCGNWIVRDEILGSAEQVYAQA